MAAVSFLKVAQHYGHPEIRPNLSTSESWAQTKASGRPNSGFLGHIEYWHGGEYSRLRYSDALKQTLIVAASCDEIQTIPPQILIQLSSEDMDTLKNLLEFHANRGKPPSAISNNVLTGVRNFEKYNSFFSTVRNTDMIMQPFLPFFIAELQTRVRMAQPDAATRQFFPDTAVTAHSATGIAALELMTDIEVAQKITKIALRSVDTSGKGKGKASDSHALSQNEMRRIENLAKNEFSVRAKSQLLAELKVTTIQEAFSSKAADVQRAVAKIFAPYLDGNESLDFASSLTAQEASGLSSRIGMVGAGNSGLATLGKNLHMIAFKDEIEIADYS